MKAGRWTLGTSLLPLTTVLLLGGLAVLYSAGQTDVPTAVTGIWLRQLVWIALGVVVAVAANRLSPRLLEWLAPAIYAVSLLLLVVTLLAGVGAGTAAGTRSWISIAGVRLGQPAELAKLATIVMLARILGGRRNPPRDIWEAIPAGIVVAVPFILVGLQPDLGSAIVFVAILFGALFWAGLRPSLLVLLLSPLLSLLFAFNTLLWVVWIVGLTGFVFWSKPYLLEGVVIWFINFTMGAIRGFLWDQLEPYQQNRLLSFLNPDIDPMATGWHIMQSKIAIGSGGLFGRGFTAGTQKRLAFLPAQHTDFIYSVVGEEFGLVGVVITLGLLASLVWVLIRIASKVTDPFSSMLVFGIACMMLTHIIVNVGMTVGLMPITGIPLPFFSYGGSFMLTCCMAIGLALRMSRETFGAAYHAG
jgi:rod shape determining protein RodA